MRALGVHCPSLKHITLCAMAWKEVTDEGIVAMVQGCPLLVTIDIGAWNKASDYYEDAFDDGSFVPTVSVTDAALYAIAQGCPNLDSFQIRSADSLAYSSSGLDAIKEGCPRLQVIYTDGEVYYAAPGCDTGGPSGYKYDSDYGWC